MKYGGPTEMENWGKKKNRGIRREKNKNWKRHKHFSSHKKEAKDSG